MAYGAIIKNGISSQIIGADQGIGAVLDTIRFYLEHNDHVDYIIIANPETEFKIEIKKDHDE